MIYLRALIVERFLSIRGPEALVVATTRFNLAECNSLAPNYSAPRCARIPLSDLVLMFQKDWGIIRAESLEWLTRRLSHLARI
jgi:hypothetical protein